MRLRRNIVLIGMMGVGKSTIGRLLNKKLDGFNYVDLDSEIEHKAKMLIAKIFETHGEPAFRSLEEAEVKACSAYNNMVISTGGGVVERSENIKRLQRNGVLFYLSASPKTLLERIEHTSDRPLLNTNSPIKVLEERLKKRKMGYMMADYEINTEKRDIISIVAEILEKYEEYEQSHSKCETQGNA